jgi:hypothetical protein
MREIDINKLMRQLGFSSEKFDAWEIEQANFSKTECQLSLSSISKLSHSSLDEQYKQIVSS